MKAGHYSEDDLTLYHYGEGRYREDRFRGGRARSRAARHLEECSDCAALYREITGTLALVVAEDEPARGDQYGLEVWQRIRHQLPEREASPFAALLRWDRVALAGAAVALVIAAFVAGRTWRGPEGAPTAANIPAPANGAGTQANADTAARQRILLASVADHLDRSERVLTDIMNASGQHDISTEQAWAEDLLTTSRLYRQDAEEAGEQSVASVLDDLERNLLEIVHSPSNIGAADLEQIRRRIDAAALLFKVRVMSDELREREAARSDAAAPRTSTSKVS